MRHLELYFFVLLLFMSDEIIAGSGFDKFRVINRHFSIWISNCVKYTCMETFAMFLGYLLMLLSYSFEWHISMSILTQLVHPSAFWIFFLRIWIHEMMHPSFGQEYTTCSEMTRMSHTRSRHDNHVTIKINITLCHVERMQESLTWPIKIWFRILFSSFWG